MYFEWKEFPFRHPPELDGRRTRYDAAIVGGGPVGLAMALSLAQRGVRCVVLETQNQVSSGSRAIGVHRRTSQFFDRLGLGGPFGATARPRGRNVIYYGDQLVAETIMSGRRKRSGRSS